MKRYSLSDAHIDGSYGMLNKKLRLMHTPYIGCIVISATLGQKLSSAYRAPKSKSPFLSLR